MFLLHEEYKKKDPSTIKTKRMSRHLYDLYKIMQTDICNAAISDHALYEDLIRHRKYYTRYSWLDYDTLKHDAICFVPPDEIMDAYEQDYSDMRTQMIYEKEPVEFPVLISSMKLLQAMVRLKHEPVTAQELFEAARKQILATGKFDNQDGQIYSATVIDEKQHSATGSKNIAYLVSLLFRGGQFYVEGVSISS
jgi:hypothetical protein